jgi:hypothetical protein
MGEEAHLYKCPFVQSEIQALARIEQTSFLVLTELFLSSHVEGERFLLPEGVHSAFKRSHAASTDIVY